MASNSKKPSLPRKQHSLDVIRFDSNTKPLTKEELQKSTNSMQQTAFIAMAAKRWRRRAKGRRLRAWTSEGIDITEDARQRAMSISKSEVRGIQRFRRVARMVYMLSTVCLTIRQYSRTRNDHGFLLELRKVQQDLLSESTNNDNPSSGSPDFDKEAFSRQKALHFPLWARLICQKPSGERRVDECARLCTFLRGMKSFTKFPRNIQLKLTQRMTYNHYDKHRILIRQGHLAHNFYFLLAGSLSVNIDTIDTKTGVKVTSTVDTLWPPSSFGENAFISHQSRTASIVSNEKVEVLVLHKSDFYDFCWEHVKQENEKKASFLRPLPLFRHWDEKSIQTILADVKKVQFPSGKLIERDAENANYIYFVMEGSIDVIYGIDRRCLRRFRKADDPLVRRATASALTCFSNESQSRRCILVEGGTLVQNDAWGVETLLQETSLCRFVNIYLQSCGCCVMQITKKRIVELAPKGSLEAYLSDYRPPMRIRQDDEICRQYLQIYAWKEYKESVVNEVMSVKNVDTLCHSAPNSRGSSGWARWPGFKIVQLPQIRSQQSHTRALSSL